MEVIRFRSTRGSGVFRVAVGLALWMCAMPSAVAAQDPGPQPASGSSAQPPGSADDGNGDAQAVEPVSGRGFWGTIGHTMPAGVSTRRPDDAGFWGRTGEGLKRLWSDGRPTVIVSGYAWHMPHKHKSERQKAFNDAAWGGGFGRTFAENDHRQRIVYAVANVDSHDQMEYMTGYAWLARWHPYGTLRLGAGYTVFLIARYEYNYVPLPLVLPAFTAGTDTVDVFATYVPYGEVILFVGRIGF